MARLSGEREQHGVGIAATEDPAQRIATVAAGFRKMFSIINWRCSMTTKNSTHPRAFLVTGASSGIGRATALLLDRNGFQVFAGVRRSEHGEDLRRQASERLTPILLDVTEPHSIVSAARTVSD